MFIRRYIWMLLSLCLLTGCSFRSLHETLSVVGEADSLWQQGQMCDDSVRLAQAYSTLRVWRIFYSDAYAHACYHYGKLLREKDDPVAAMQVFIDATHSRTRDYHILGRVYNNMGDICHRAGDYELSYDMFERSAQIFLSDNDTLSYYYCLNDMAFEKAMEADKDAVITLVDYIEYNSLDAELRLKIIETKAELYLKCQQYDSAVFCAQLCSQSPLSRLIKAQAYSYMGQKDSAVYYANQILRHSSDAADIHNALYIITNDDDSKDQAAIRQTAAERADNQKLLEIQHGSLSRAVQLLEQDLQRTPNLIWLLAIFVTLLVVGVLLYGYMIVKSRRHQLLSQKIRDIEIKNRERIEQKRAQIECHCAQFINSKDFKMDMSWNDYNKMCDVINQYFYLLAKKLQLDYNLSEREVRLCVLSLFDFGYDRMAELLFYAPNGVGKLKMRVARKVGTTAKNLRQFLIEKAIGN